LYENLFALRTDLEEQEGNTRRDVTYFLFNWYSIK